MRKPRITIPRPKGMFKAPSLKPGDKIIDTPSHPKFKLLTPAEVVAILLGNKEVAFDILGGWTNGKDCSGTPALFTMEFSKDIHFTDATGVSFVNMSQHGDILTAGDFSTACGVDWTCGNGATIDTVGGSATLSPIVISSISQPVVATAGLTYKVTMTITATVGAIQVTLNGGDIAYPPTTAGTHTFDVVAGNVNTDFNIAIAGGSVTIDDVKVGLPGVAASSVGHNVLSTSSPQSIIHYDVVWGVSPIAGDIIEFRFDNATGNYSESDGGSALPDQTFEITNCLT